MKKVTLEIVNLTSSQAQTGAYVLVLGETTGAKRRLPIVIGAFEAQAIAIQLENMKPSRPLTHDLFKNFANAFNINVIEVCIFSLMEGVFYAKIICSDDIKEAGIDARTSDAIALAVRFGCPITTYESILDKAGILLDEHALTEETSKKDDDEEEDESDELSLLRKSTEELTMLLDKALNDEDYEKASKIRDELNNRKKS